MRNLVKFISKTGGGGQKEIGDVYRISNICRRLMVQRILNSICGGEEKTSWIARKTATSLII